MFLSYLYRDSLKYLNNSFKFYPCIYCKFVRKVIRDAHSDLRISDYIGQLRKCMTCGNYIFLKANYKHSETPFK